MHYRKQYGLLPPAEGASHRKGRGGGPRGRAVRPKGAPPMWPSSSQAAAPLPEPQGGGASPLPSPSTPPLGETRGGQTTGGGAGCGGGDGGRSRCEKTCHGLEARPPSSGSLPQAPPAPLKAPRGEAFTRAVGREGNPPQAPHDPSGPSSGPPWAHLRLNLGPSSSPLAVAQEGHPPQAQRAQED